MAGGAGRAHPSTSFLTPLNCSVRVWPLFSPHFFFSSSLLCPSPPVLNLFVSLPTVLPSVSFISSLTPALPFPISSSTLRFYSIHLPHHRPTSLSSSCPFFLLAAPVHLRSRVHPIPCRESSATTMPPLPSLRLAGSSLSCATCWLRPVGVCLRQAPALPSPGLGCRPDSGSQR